MKAFSFPKSPKLKYAHSLVKLANKVIATKDTQVEFNLTETIELDSLSISFLCGLADISLENNQKLVIRYKSNRKIKSVVDIINDSIQKNKITDFEIGNNKFQLARITSNNNMFIDRMLVLLQKELKFGEDTKGSMRLVLSELLTNAIDHSGDQRAYICIGRWPNSSYLHLVCLDFGVGIPTKLRTRYPELDTDVKAFEEQHRRGLTTRIKRDGGKGYKLIQDILKFNKGRLSIISNYARVNYRYDKSDYKIWKTKLPFHGTCVDIQFNPSKGGFDEILNNKQIEELF